MFFIKKPHLVKEVVSLENKYILDQALSRKKGVILVSGHFGNFPLMLLRLKAAGYLINGIVRPMRDERVEKMFSKIKNDLEIKTIHSKPPKACVNSIIRALKNNEIVFILLDQNFGTGGIFVDFFGRKAATAVGPAVLALRTKAAIVPCFIVREEDNTQKIVIEQEFRLEKKKDFNQTVLINIQKLTSIIESYIRRYPSQWAWIHRRWKTKPKP